MYAMVVRDRYGNERPVDLGFLSSEKADSINAFFDAFKRCHKTWTMMEFFFVDKDYKKIRSIKKISFPLLCCAALHLAFPCLIEEAYSQTIRRNKKASVPLLLWVYFCPFGRRVPNELS